jgi:hypothetical protein
MISRERRGDILVNFTSFNPVAVLVRREHFDFYYGRNGRFAVRLAISKDIPG